MSTRNKIRNSLRFSFLDGLFASCMVGLTTDYITPYALYLKATASQIGILAAAPNLVSSIVQLKSADLTERLNGRKKTINLSVLLHTLMLLPIMLIPYLFKRQSLIYLVIFFTLFTSFNAFAAPVWSSLMSEHIPYKMRGKYFGWRNKVLGAVTIASAFAAGIILTRFKNNVLTGFLIIFSLAFLSRFISWYFLTRMYEPVFRPKKESYFSLFDFIRRAKESNFARFVIFVASLNFCVSLASPFFSVFMLKDLRFNYLTYTLIVTTVSIAGVFTIDRWGKIADKIGNIKILKTNALIIASLPLWWIFNQSPAYLIFIQLVSGFAWAGFNLCAVNFIYDAVTPQKRIRCIAYFNVFSGIALCLGAILGGTLVNNLPLIFKYRILSLFLVSSILRFFTVFLISGKINEVRTTEKISSRDLFYSVLGIKPILGVTRESQQLVRDEV
ncbi:MAG: MFS transporter [Candidatus Omnitrophota bacterium]